MYLTILCEIAFVAAAVVIAAYYIFLVPPRQPHNIPAIPFWVALIPFFKEVDQCELFRRYVETPLRKHGAVKLFFGAQWNILVQRPSYVAEMFRYEDIYQKSGNQKKIPHSVFAAFLGDNIISSYGEDWKLYQSVVKPGLQKNFDAAPLVSNASALSGLICDAQTRAGSSGIPVQELLQRYTIANTTRVLLQTDVPTLQSENTYLHKLQSALKREIFKPIFMNFPVLDRLPVPSRQRARKLAAHFTDELAAGLFKAREKKSQDLLPDGDELGPRLLAAREAGVLTEQQFRDNLTIAFVASQENPQLLLISTLYLLAKHQDVQSQLHQEIVRTETLTPTADLLSGMPLLTAVVFEALRLLPPINQLINRRAVEDTFLGGDLFIPKGTYLGYNCYSTNREQSAWGPDADDFRPARWGESVTEIQRLYRQRRSRAEFITFHGGRRACLGERFALLETKTTLFVLLRQLSWLLDPTWMDRKTPVRYNPHFASTFATLHETTQAGSSACVA